MCVRSPTSVLRSASVVVHTRCAVLPTTWRPRSFSARFVRFCAVFMVYDPAAPAVALGRTACNGPQMSMFIKCSYSTTYIPIVGMYSVVILFHDSGGFLCNLYVARAGSGVERIDPLRFLAGYRKRRLNHCRLCLSS